MPRSPRSLPLAVAAALLAAAHPSPARAGWAHRQVAFVLQRGIFPRIDSVDEFHGGRPLTAGALAKLVAALPDGVAQAAPRDPAAPVTIHQLNAAFVRALGVREAAADVARGLRAAGLRPPAGAGIEITARALGLRFDHPSADDRLEPLSSSRASRAEGAYTAWKALREDAAQVDAVRTELTGFALPRPAASALPALRRALAVTGAPYVWGGASLADGGFDCSGLVTMAEKRAEWLGGRTTYDMARATPRGDRLRLDELEPGDLVLFGPRGPRSKPGAVGHAGLALGDGWFVHASSEGVALSRLDSSYYRRTFAWGRRPPAA